MTEEKMIEAVADKEAAFHESFNNMIKSLDPQQWNIDKVREGLYKSGIPMCVFHSLYEAGYKAALRAVREFEAQQTCDATPCPTCPEYEVCGGRVDLPTPPKEK